MYEFFVKVLTFFGVLIDHDKMNFKLPNNGHTISKETDVDKEVIKEYKI